MSCFQISLLLKTKLAYNIIRNTRKYYEFNIKNLSFRHICFFIIWLFNYRSFKGKKELTKDQFCEAAEKFEQKFNELQDKFRELTSKKEVKVDGKVIEYIEYKATGTGWKNFTLVFPTDSENPAIDLMGLELSFGLSTLPVIGSLIKSGEGLNVPSDLKYYSLKKGYSIESETLKMEWDEAGLSKTTYSKTTTELNQVQEETIEYTYKLA